MTDFLGAPFTVTNINKIVGGSGIIDQLHDSIEDTISDSSDTKITDSKFLKTDALYFLNDTNLALNITKLVDYYDGDFIYDKAHTDDLYKNIFKNNTFGNITSIINNNLDFNFLLKDEYYDLMFYLDFKLQFIAQLNMYYNTYYEFNSSEDSPLYNTIFIYNSRFRYYYDTVSSSYKSTPIDLKEEKKKCIIKFKLDRVTNSQKTIFEITFDSLEIDIKNKNPTNAEITNFQSYFTTIVNTDYSVTTDYLKLQIYNESKSVVSDNFKCSTYIKEKRDYLFITSFIFYKIIIDIYDSLGPDSGEGSSDTQNEYAIIIENFINKLNSVLSNNIISLIKQENLINEKNDNRTNREKTLPFGTKKHNLFSAQKISNELHKSSINIEENIEKVNKQKGEIKIKQKKLENLQIISIVTIVLFVITILLLLFINKIKEYNIFSIFIYIYSIFLVLFSIFIIYYLRNLNNVENFEVPVTSISPSLSTKLQVQTKYLTILVKLNKINDIYDNVTGLAFCDKLSLDYSDLINPLLNNEKKKYDRTEKNSELKEKIIKFNYNITNRDVQYNLKMIEFMIRLLILMIITLLLIYNLDNYIIIIGIISISIFLILLVIYFIEIIRIVRTNSKTYYWNKPEKEKEIIT